MTDGAIPLDEARRRAADERSQPPAPSPDSYGAQAPEPGQGRQDEGALVPALGLNAPNAYVPRPHPDDERPREWAPPGHTASMTDAELTAALAEIAGCLLDPDVFTDYQPRPIEWIWKPFLVRRGYTYFGGPEGSGKTRLIIELAVCRALGLDFLGYEVKRGKSLLWLAEDSKDSVGRLLLQICRGYNVEPRELAGRIAIVPRRGKDPRLWDSHSDFGNRFVYQTPGFRYVDMIINHFEPDLVVLDSAMKVIGRVNQNDEWQSEQVTQQLLKLSEDYDLAALLLAHPPFHGGAEKLYYGSKPWVGNADIHIGLLKEKIANPDLEQGPELDEARVFHHIKHRHTKNRQKPFKVAFVGGRMKRQEIDNYDLFVRVMSDMIKADTWLSPTPNSTDYFVPAMLVHPDIRKARMTKEQLVELWKLAFMHNREFVVSPEKSPTRNVVRKIGINEEKQEVA
jgi:hypothetical protein